MTAQPELLHRTTTKKRSLSPPASRFVVPLGLIAIAAYCAIASRGFLEADEITHFLNSRSVWYDKRMLLSIWGRLGCTGLYALVTPLGVIGARLLAVGIMVLVGWGTAILLREFVRNVGGNRSWVARHGTALAWGLLFAQPCFAMNSFTVIAHFAITQASLKKRCGSRWNRRAR